MLEKQKTIFRQGKISGIGLHTGKESTVHFRPGQVDSGIRFYKRGVPIGDLAAEKGLASTDMPRCSSIGDERNRLLTVEHLLASLRGLGITNIEMDVDGDEIPGLDGSCLPFVRCFKELGITEQNKPADVYRVSEPIFCYDKQKAISIMPADVFSVSYLLDYEHPYLRAQKADFVLRNGNFEKEIAPARTFCTEAEGRQLQALRLGLGANLENTLVVREDGSHVQTQRFENECARHKILDIFGDLNLLGFPVLGHVTAIRSGHALNRQMARQIKKQREVSHADGR